MTALTPPAVTVAPFRIAIVANKTWEVEPLVAALLAKDARPPALTDFKRGYDPVEELLKDPSTGKPYPLPPEADGLPVRGKLPIRPRLSLRCGQAEIEVWCVEDWMRAKRKKPSAAASTEVAASGSSSHEKFTFSLAQISKQTFSGGAKSDLVIAFGTAGIPVPETLNGCVTIGSRCFLHDPWAGALQSEIDDQIERFGPLLQKEVAADLHKAIESPRLHPTLFSADLSPECRHAAEARFLSAPVNPAQPARILAGHGYASLGTLNICDYDDYIWADDETLQRFPESVRKREIGSMESTHGLIRLTWRDTPFLFVSALTDRVPMFNAEVTPRKYAQNFAPAHNAGVALAHLLPDLVRLSDAGKLLRPASAAVANV